LVGDLPFTIPVQGILVPDLTDSEGAVGIDLNVGGEEGTARSAFDASFSVEPGSCGGTEDVEHLSRFSVGASRSIGAGDVDDAIRGLEGEDVS